MGKQLDTMNTKEYAQSLRASIDRNRYASLIRALGTELNDHKSRFDKSDIIEQSLAAYTNDRLTWVDLVGRDHYDNETGYDLEFKFMNNGLFTSKGKKKPVVKVKLKNSLGKHKGVSVEDPADYYLFGQQDSIAIISWKDIEQYLVAVPDGIEAHVPHESLEFVFLPEEVTVSMTNVVSYKKAKAEAQRKLIESIV